jgi:hypothetical protein
LDYLISMSGYKVKQRVRPESSIKKINNDLWSLEGTLSRAKKVTIADVGGYTKEINILLGEGKTVIATNTEGYSAPIQFEGYIVAWTLAEVSSGNIAGTAVIDITKSSDYPPTGSDSISPDPHKPKLVQSSLNSDTSLLEWSTKLEVGDSIGFKVLSNINCRQLHLVLTVKVVS